MLKQNVNFWWYRGSIFIRCMQAWIFETVYIVIAKGKNKRSQIARWSFTPTHLCPSRVYSTSRIMVRRASRVRWTFHRNPTPRNALSVFSIPVLLFCKTIADGNRPSVSVTTAYWPGSGCTSQWALPPKLHTCNLIWDLGGNKEDVRRFTVCLVCQMPILYRGSVIGESKLKTEQTEFRYWFHLKQTHHNILWISSLV